MRYVIALVVVIMFSGCTYHVYKGECAAGCMMSKSLVKAHKKARGPTSAAQMHTNRTWGTTKLVPINVRKIPESARREAKCNQGKIKYCEKD
jgi:hypothetical protein